MNWGNSEFVLYVDEAGDPGLKAIAPHDDRGASEWFLLGGVLLRAHYEDQLVDWVKDIRKRVGAHQGDSLHFRKLSASRREAACRLVADLPIRAFVVASHKRNMKGYRNIQAASLSAQDWFYNWCLRLLLERVTGAVARSYVRSGQEVSPIRIVLAERGGHSYAQTSVYLRHLQQQAKYGTSVLKKRLIVPEAVDWQLLENVQANKSAGAQLADIVVSAFYGALRRNGKNPLHSIPARCLRPVMAKEDGRVDDCGLVLQPTPHESEIDAIFKDIFRFYGHVL